MRFLTLVLATALASAPLPANDKTTDRLNDAANLFSGSDGDAGSLYSAGSAEQIVLHGAGAPD
ncbi:MAG: hypothetical protein WDO73_08110 [Ignavibacteriota bacterium]